MKQLLKLEELAQLVLGIFLFSQLSFSWWWFPALILFPDISMIGYLFNPKIGAWIYNLFHLKVLGVGIIVIGLIMVNEQVSLSGIILFSHAAFDRIFGYRLKYETAFKDTHLGKIGNK